MFIYRESNPAPTERGKVEVLFPCLYTVRQQPFFKVPTAIIHTELYRGHSYLRFDHLRAYHQDFRDSAFLLREKQQSESDLLDKEILQSTQKDKQLKEQARWEKDTRTIMNGIEKHLNSCDFHLGYKKPSDGHLYYTDIRSADLIAQASHQLATKFHLRKNVGSKNLCRMRSLLRIPSS